MARSRSSAKQAGTRTERTVADYLAAAFGDERIDRRVKRGADDRGDIAGVTSNGHKLVIEVKDHAKQALPQWVKEAHVEANNDGALAGVVVSKRRGTTNPGEYWVHMTVDDLLALLTGRRHGHRVEQGG